MPPRVVALAMSSRTVVVAAALILACSGAAPRIENVPPTADADVALSDGMVLHARELPLARMDGVILDGARFDSTGTRIAFVATFPFGSVAGDWRRARPVQAYVADLARRTLTAVTSGGRTATIRWRDASHVLVDDDGTPTLVAVAAPARVAPGRALIAAVTPSTSGSLVSPPDEFRLQVFKTSDRSYAVGQVGAVRLRTVAVGPDGRAALVGKYVIWIDGAKNGGGPFARSGPDAILPPAFADSAYGSALTPLLPLGHVAYQAAYRNGVAYLAFSYGLRRIVAATSDFVTYAYPQLPRQPAFTVGDGLGAGADGVLYFAAPDSSTLQYWKGDRYVEQAMRLPDDASDERRLLDAMTRLSPSDALRPPMRPDGDALEAAMLEWRVYPIGDSTGQRWVASYLGRTFIAGSDARFREIASPGFPFAVLGRTDDGRLWGAAPLTRSTRGAAVVSATSRLMVSRDGERWTTAAVLNGDPGAVGLHDGVPWVALTAYEGDAMGVDVASLDGAAQTRASTGAIYAGEDLFFAGTASGFYLICGGAPGSRLDDGSGPLVALRLDASRLFAFDSAGHDVYLADRLDPLHLEDRPATAAPPFLDATLRELGTPSAAYGPTIVSDDAPFVPHFRSVTPEAEREFEVEYAWRPYPIGAVRVTVDDGSALVRRSVYRGPLAGDGRTERWTRDAAGRWHQTQTLSTWHL